MSTSPPTQLVQVEFLWTGKVTLHARAPLHWSDDEIVRAAQASILPHIDFDHEAGEVKVLSVGRNVPPPRGTLVEVLREEDLDPRHDGDRHAVGD